MTKDNYYGERYSYGYNGLYNLDLDKSLIFGVEREDEQIGYNKDLTGIKREFSITQLQVFMIISKDLQITCMQLLDQDLTIIR